MNTKKLYRSTNNKVILGVMGGIGEYFDVDPVLIRVIYIVITIATAVVPGIIGYILMAVIMPVRPGEGGHEVRHEHNTSEHKHEKI